MEENKSKSIVAVILSIIAGLVSSFVAFILFILIFMGAGLFGWSDGGEKEYLERLERNTNLTFVISILLALCVGVYVILKMNKNKKQKVNHE